VTVKKVDLTMWAKNGSRFLPSVLKRIDEVIPPECVNKRIFVDDKSTDNSVEIAEDFDWSVYPNREGFVRGGVIEALQHVTEEFFVSVEQDVLLSKQWWEKIPKQMDDPKVAVAQGVRLSSNKSLRSIQEYTLERKPELIASPTLDNNIWRTKVIRQIDIPKEYVLYIDGEVHYRILKYTPYKWIIDKNVVSTHLQPSLSYTVKHYQRLTPIERHRRRQELDYATFSRILKILMFSPFRSLDIVAKKHDPAVFFIYPLVRLMTVKLFLIRKKLIKSQT